jgi:myb proto-oncogene protein
MPGFYFAIPSPPSVSYIDVYHLLLIFNYWNHLQVPHPSRSGLGTSGSPSRFAPMGHHGHPLNLPTLSVSGTYYAASSPSPSPAASGGTSAFKDARHPSPWN